MAGAGDKTIIGGGPREEPPGRGAGGAGDLTDALERTSVWEDRMVADAGIPLEDVPLVSVGGGLGSLALIDTLRIAGVPTDEIRVITDLSRPTETYEYLAANSQIPPGERLRSDAGSVMDNIWGFPSYAIREAWEDRSLAQVWRVLTEPVLSEYFTPKAGQVYRSVARETARIGWERMVRRGYARMVRKRAGGGYFVLTTPPAGTSATKRVAFRTSYVHLAVGYPGVKFLDDLQDYRERHEDYQRVVNAYEPHEHVYQEALRRPVTVLVRGNGIVASRVLQRLLDDRERNGAQTTVLHLFRNYVGGPQGTRATFRRPGGMGFAYQAFNYPKAAWGGQLRETLEALEGDERRRLIDTMGGTNTAPRADWRHQLERGLSDGHYRQMVGTVVGVVPSADRRAVLTQVRQSDGIQSDVAAEFVIDATGLEADLSEHRLMGDLLSHTGAGRNPKNRLDVEPHFEVRGTRSGEGRLYASGAMTLGGYYAGVDSFLGLQYAALKIADDLAGRGFGRRIGPGRSIAQWWRWARNVAP